MKRTLDRALKEAVALAMKIGRKNADGQVFSPEFDELSVEDESDAGLVLGIYLRDEGEPAFEFGWATDSPELRHNGDTPTQAVDSWIAETVVQTAGV